MSGRRVKLKGYKVSKSKSGKAILEPIPYFAMNASQKVAARKSKAAVRVARRTPSA